MSRSVTVINNAVVLKNRGFKVRVCKLKQCEDGSFARIENEEGVPETEERWFKFTNMSLATMEEPEPTGWGGLDPWSDTLETTPFRTIAKTFAIVYDLFRFNEKTGQTEADWRAGALMLEEGAIGQYAAVLIAALQLSQGVSPEACGEMVKDALAESDEDLLDQTQSVWKALEEARQKRQEAKLKKAEAEAAAATDTPTSPTTVSPSSISSATGPSLVEAGMSSGL